MIFNHLPEASEDGLDLPCFNVRIKSKCLCGISFYRGADVFAAVLNLCNITSVPDRCVVSSFVVHYSYKNNVIMFAFTLQLRLNSRICLNSKQLYICTNKLSISLSVLRNMCTQMSSMPHICKNGDFIETCFELFQPKKSPSIVITVCFNE